MRFVPLEFCSTDDKMCDVLGLPFRRDKVCIPGTPPRTPVPVKYNGRPFKPFGSWVSAESSYWFNIEARNLGHESLLVLLAKDLYRVPARHHR